jgi:hypothetical protein
MGVGNIPAIPARKPFPPWYGNGAFTYASHVGIRHNSIGSNKIPVTSTMIQLNCSRISLQTALMPSTSQSFLQRIGRRQDPKIASSSVMNKKKSSKVTNTRKCLMICNKIKRNHSIIEIAKATKQTNKQSINQTNINRGKNDNENENDIKKLVN